MVTVFSWLGILQALLQLFFFLSFFFYNFIFSYIYCYLFIFLQIVLTVAEHHSAIVPWQLVAQKTGAILKFVNLTEDEVPDVEKLKEMISRKTKLLVVHHISNVLGR